MTARDPETQGVREAFHRVIEVFRRSRGLTVAGLAEQTGVDRQELAALERNPAYRPSPLTLYRLATFFGIPDRKLAMVAGAVRDMPPDVRERAFAFAAQSESFSKLTAEEQRALDEFVAYLRSEASRSAGVEPACP